MTQNFKLILFLLLANTIILYAVFHFLTEWERTDATYNRLTKGQDKLRARVAEQNNELRSLRAKLRAAERKIEELEP